MTTVAQIQANRLNAQKSTGPRTPEGKERASQNALKHGLLAREAVIQGEDPEEFEIYREGMLQELAPVGVVEAMLAERVVGLSWRLLRAERLQNAAFAALDDGEPTELLDARHEEWKQVKGSEWDRGICGVIDEDAALGQVVVEDFGGARVLDRLLMYERRIESSLYRTMAELRRERQARTAAAGPEEVSRSEGDLATGEESVTKAELASFGADATPGVQAQKAAFGSSEPPAGIANGTETLHVGQNHGRDAHATGTEHVGQSHGRDARAPIPSFHRSSPIPDAPAEGESCETNPISGGVSSWACQAAKAGIHGEWGGRSECCTKLKEVPIGASCGLKARLRSPGQWISRPTRVRSSTSAGSMSRVRASSVRRSTISVMGQSFKAINSSANRKPSLSCRRPTSSSAPSE